MIISAAPSNQLGNTLFNHGHLHARARELGRLFANPWLDRYADQFPAMEGDPFCAGLNLGLPRELAAPVRRHFARMVSRLADLHSRCTKRGCKIPGVSLVESGWTSTKEAQGGVIMVDGEDFSATARSRGVTLVRGPLFRFSDHAAWAKRWRAPLRELFRPRSADLALAAEAAGRARSKGSPVVGVHIRRGDFAHFMRGRYFYSWDEYRILMRGFARRWGKVSFVVCSNEKLPDELLSDLPAVAGPSGLLSDLHALALCDFIIGPPSTYSAWAAFVGEKPLHHWEDPSRIPDVAEFLQ